MICIFTLPPTPKLPGGFYWEGDDGSPGYEAAQQFYAANVPTTTDDAIYTSHCVVCGLPDTGGGVYRSNGYHHWPCAEYESDKEEFERLKKKIQDFEQDLKCRAFGSSRIVECGPK